jgi:hypothetical protein
MNLKRPASRRLIVLIGAVIAALSVAGVALAASGETPVTVKVGELELTANGGFTPTAISGTKDLSR